MIVLQQRLEGPEPRHLVDQLVRQAIELGARQHEVALGHRLANDGADLVLQLALADLVDDGEVQLFQQALV